MKHTSVKINEAIRSPEVRVLLGTGDNLGVMGIKDALARARELGLDLIEISPDANPPVAKIMDYGKFQYDQKKKQKEIKARVHQSEVKSLQIKIGTGENDVQLKAKKASEWLLQGHRVKLELFLRGRTKFLEKGFLEEKLHNFLSHIGTPHKTVEGFKESPKGIVITIEQANKK